MGKDEVKMRLSTSDVDKRTPKYCNMITFAKLTSGDIVMSFFYNEDESMIDDQGNKQSILIDRIIVDEDHAQKVVDSLGGLIKKDHE